MHRWGHDAVVAVRRTPPREVRLVALVVAVGVAMPFVVTTHVVVAVVTTVASAALVLVRDRRPVLALLGAALASAVTPMGAMPGAMITAFTAGRRVGPVGRLLLVTGGTIVLTTVVGVWVERGEEPLHVVFLLQAVGAVVLVGLPALAGALLGRRRPLSRLLRERNEYLERATLLTAASARARERTRIAGEMHDLLGHRLSLISMHAGALEYGLAASAPQLSAQAELLRTTAGTAMDELRQILLVLGVAGGEEDAELTGTRADVTALVELSRDAGVDARLEWTGDDLSDVDVRTRRAVHRAVREGLTNVHRHAAAAAAVVAVGSDEDRVRVAVTNGPASDGRDAPGTGRGLVGVGERVALLGGTFTAAAESGGFALRLDVPRRPEGVTHVPVTDDLGAEVPPPRRADVLTVPRMLGLGCLVLAVAVPLVLTVGGIVVLLLVG